MSYSGSDFNRSFINVAYYIFLSYYYTVTKYTPSFIERNVAFILDAAGTASFIVNIMEKQTDGGGKCGENRRKRNKFSLFNI